MECGRLFCPDCSSLAFIGKDQILRCSDPDCAYEGPADPKVASISSTSKAKRREFETVEAGPVLGVLTKDAHICPKCENMEVFVELRQTRASDEPETRICTCAGCSHKWREY